MNRRGFLAALVGAVCAPVAAKLAKRSRCLDERGIAACPVCGARARCSSAFEEYSILCLSVEDDHSLSIRRATREKAVAAWNALPRFVGKRRVVAGDVAEFRKYA